MIIEGTRFGRIEVADEKLIRIPAGLLGFPDHTRFVLHEHDNAPHIAWLQSVDNPNLAFPVMDGEYFGSAYPDPSASELAASAGLPADDAVILVIVVPRSTPPTIRANLLSPVVIDAGTRTGAQVVLDPRKYSASHVITRPTMPEAQETKEKEPEVRHGHGRGTHGQGKIELASMEP